eukprot:5292360-Prymnesium_polylepis.1
MFSSSAMRACSSLLRCSSCCCSPLSRCARVAPALPGRCCDQSSLVNLPAEPRPSKRACTDAIGRGRLTPPMRMLNV